METNLFMRSFFFLLLFLFHFSNSFCNPPSDSLEKYSYNVIGFTFPTGVYFGTGFFIRNKGFIYFISAMHVLTGCDHGILPNKFPDEMNVFLKDPMQIISIPTKNIREKYSCRDLCLIAIILSLELITNIRIA